MERSGYSRDELSWLGPRRKFHYDRFGRMIGWSRNEPTWLGDHVAHYDAAGRRLGTSRKEAGWLGPKEVHRDLSGRVTGESMTRRTIGGGAMTTHYDAQGRSIGMSHKRPAALSGGHVDNYSRAARRALGGGGSSPDPGLRLPHQSTLSRVIEGFESRPQSMAPTLVATAGVVVLVVMIVQLIVLALG